jgi:hypothetical protein
MYAPGSKERASPILSHPGYYFRFYAAAPVNNVQQTLLIPAFNLLRLSSK